MRPATLLALALTFAASASTLASTDEPKASTAPVPAGAYSLDKAHTSLVFRISHLGFSSYVGRFTRVDANLKFDPRNLASSSVSVDIDPASIEADNAPSGFMQTLAGKDWLDAERYPQLSFRSNSVEATGGNAFRINGELTLHGVTRPVTLEARYNGGYAGHTFEPRARVGFSAQGSIKRSDFGISQYTPLPGTTFGIGDEIVITLESEFFGPALN